MAISPLLLSLVLAQDPAPAAPLRLDVVELKGGEVLEGRIVLELPNYLEIELEPGAVVGFRTTDVAAVRHGAGSLVAAAAAADALAPRDDWFGLHDGAGRPVGWLHATVTRAGDGTTRLLEEWEFSQDRRCFQVTMLETTDAAQQPATCYFRERVSEEVFGRAPGDPSARSTRLRGERIVEAKVDGAVLHVDRLTPEGRTEQQLDWPQGASFPLLARARQRCSGAAATVQVFDPAVEELTTRAFAAERTRTVTIDGAQAQVRELIEHGTNGENAMWLDAAARILRREIAGPALIAVPCAKEQAQAADAPAPAAFVADASLRIGLWRPNPAWERMPSTAGGISLHCAPHDATISLSALDYLDHGTTLPAAADTVERWFRLLRPELRRDRRDWTKVRGRDAIVLTFAGRLGTRVERATLHVVPWPDGFLVLTCMAPAAAWGELQHDFESVVQQLELEPGAVATMAQDVPAAVAKTDAAAAPPPPGAAAPVRVRVPAGGTEGGR